MPAGIPLNRGRHRSSNKTNRPNRCITIEGALAMRTYRLFALLMSLASLALAGSLSAAPTSAPADSSYRLRTEDVIEITVMGLPQLGRTVTILPDSTISFPRLGTIHAAGKTLDELKTELYRGLDRFYNNLDITVSVKSLRIDRASVTGAVRNNGSFDLRPGWTVRELLAAGGGLSIANGQPAPEQIRATLVRRNGQRIPLTLAQLLSQPGAPDVPTLEPDDQLVVEDLTIQVSVDGEVNRPANGISLLPGATVVDALRAVGGFTSKAALTRAQILRGAQTIAVNLRPYVNGTATSEAPPVLQRGDILFIPENKNHVVVLGGVQKPGPVLVPEDEALLLTEAIAQAGGLVERSRIDQVHLVRQVEGQPTDTVINVRDILTKGKLDRNLNLRPGDMVYVPSPKLGSGFNPMSLVGLLPFLF
jgi:protein involved in polysaccharide export with SLBB domain